MARTRRTTPSAETEPPNSLVASAARLSGSSYKDYARISRGKEWHGEAWSMYRTVGEFRYACDWVGSMLSKAILFATKEASGRAAPVKEGAPAELIESLFGDADGRAEMLRLIGIHLSVTGQCYIVSYPTTNDSGREVDKWEVVSSTALSYPRGTSADEKWRINGVEVEANRDDVLVTEIWRPDPEDSRKAISPARAVLPILAEIVKLTQHVAAQVDSRLAGAGLLLMPSEMSLPAPPQTADGAIQKSANTADELMKIIQEAMAEAIANRANPSALVPIVLTAPAEAIAAVKHMTFWTELDEHAIDLRNEAIRRLALGMDMPPEVLTGNADSNHWSAWASDDSAIKSHTEPLLKIITSALAEGYLRPLLDDDDSMANEVIEDYSIHADTSEMRLRPNRSKEALELYDRGVLSAEALIRETGFDDEDAMGEEARRLFYLQKVASGSTTPELVEAALRELGLALGVNTAPSEDTQEGRPPPSLVEHPVRDIPDQERSERRKIARERGDVPSAAANEALVAASEQIVIRALERAGNKMKNRMQSKPVTAAMNIYMTVPVKESEMDFLLDDAWTQVEALAQRHDLDPRWLSDHLESYCRMLMKERTEHSYSRFTDYAATMFINSAPRYKAKEVAS